MSISPWKAQCFAKNAWLRHRWCGHRVTYGHSPCSGAMSQSITTAWSSTKPICLTTMPCGNGWVAWWNLKALAHAKQGYFGRTGNGTIPVGPRGYPHCYGSPWLISQRKPWWHQRGRSRWVLAMKKYALLHIYLPQFAMSASLPLLSKRAQYAQCIEKSQLLHHISMPLLLSHSIWYIFDHILLYFAIFCFYIWRDIRANPTKGKWTAVPRVLTKDELTSVQVRLEVFVSRMEGNICTTFPDVKVKVFWLMFFPYLPLQIKSLKPFETKFSPAALARRPLGMIWCFRAAWIWRTSRFLRGWRPGNEGEPWKKYEKILLGFKIIRHIWDMLGWWSINTLWWTNIAMENHNFNGKIHYKWPFSIAMLNYQRVS